MINLTLPGVKTRNIQPYLSRKASNHNNRGPVRASLALSLFHHDGKKRLDKEKWKKADLSPYFNPSAFIR